MNQRSPHHTDRTALLPARQWVTERFTDAEVRADGQLQVTVRHG